MHKTEDVDPEKRRAAEYISSSINELSDEALLRAIVAGADWPMEPLYQRYGRILYSLAYRMVADHQVAEDLVQESLLAVWRRADSYSAKSGAVRSWIISILHHRTIDYLRSVRRRSVLKQATWEEVELDESTAFPDVWDEAWRSVQGGQVRLALLKLSPEQRQVIELAYFQGLTHTEIASGYYIPLGTVKARMRLGLIHLRQILKEMGLQEP